MSITGSYRVIDGKVIKVSDEIPKVAHAVSDICTFKEPYWEEHLDAKPVFVKSRGHKAQLLKERGCVEKAPVRGGINSATKIK